MAGKKRTDNKGRILKTGEMQRSEDNRYLYRYVDLTGKKRTIYMEKCNKRFCFGKYENFTDKAVSYT